jgi:hypothetical protein
MQRMKIEEVGQVDDQGLLRFEVAIDVGRNQRSVSLSIPSGEPGPAFRDNQQREPVDVTKAVQDQMGSVSSYFSHKSRYARFVAFRNLVYCISSATSGRNFEVEALLLVKKHVYLQDRRLQKLQAEVEALEKLEKEESKPRREPIPDFVRMVVYERDGGKCVKCGSKQTLHFDHVIPVSMGGGNTEQNIQLLCERCNLQKGANLF